MNTTSLVLLAMFGFAAAPGCGTVRDLALTPDAHTDGTWTGRLTSLTVADDQGNEYPAAGLKIESGPRDLRHSPTHYRVAEGDVAYLSRDGATVVNPKELGVPADARLRVSGTMTFAGAGVRVEDMPGKPKVFRYVRRTAGAPPGGMIIRLRGTPRVLNNGAAADN